MTAALTLIGLTLCQNSFAAARAQRIAPRAAASTAYSLEIITPARKNPPFVPGNTRIIGINNVGQVVGWSSVGNDSNGDPISHAFRYEGGKLIDLGAPGAGSKSSASSINDAGRVVGYYMTTAPQVFGYFTAPNSGITTSNDLPTVIPNAVNNRDEYVGTDQTTFLGIFVSPITGSHLFTLGDFNSLNGISSPSAGQPVRIVGSFSTLANPAAGRGVLWTDTNANGTVDNGETVVLQPFDPNGASTATAVNNAGQAVGQSDHPSGAPHGFVYSASTGQTLDLGTLPASGLNIADSNATAINENGDIAGYSLNRAVVWKKDAGGVYRIQDLNLSIPGGTGTFVAQRAYGINSSGQIVGEGTQDGLTVGFLLTPIPPPPTADLSVTQSVSASPGKVSQPLTYTITARNNGPSTAASVVVRDTLPAGLPSTTTQTVTGTASTSGGVVTWNVGTLTSGQSATLTITGTPTAAVTLNNSAAISGNVTDENPANDTSALSTPVANLSADLALTVTPTSDTATVGQNLTYNLVVTNNGPDAAAGAVITANVPSGASFVSATPSVTPSAGTVTLNAGTLASGASFTATLVVKPTTVGTLQENASVTSTTGDPNSANNAASASTPVQPVTADLGVAVSASATSVKVGQSVTYTVTVTNNGPSDATNVAVTDVVPGSLGSVTVKTATGTASNANGTVTWNVGTLANGKSATLTVTGTTGAAGTATSSASLASDVNDNNAANDTAAANVTVNDLTADLSVTQSAPPAPIKVGSTLTYTVTATNSGPDSAVGVVVTDTLPAGLQNVTLVTGKGTVSQNGGVVTWNAGTFTSGQNAILTITGTTSSAGTAVNSVSVSGSTTDPNAANNTSTTSTTVNPLTADLSVSIAAGTATGQVGQNLTYTLRVSNSGPDAATGVVVTANVPDGAAFISATPNATVNGNVVTFNVGSVGAGSPVAVTLVVKPNAAGSVLETATVAGTSVDPAQANNSANLSLLVTTEPPQQLPPSDLTGQWTGTVHPVIHGKGKTAYYTLEASFTVKNVGEGPAAPFKVRFLASKNTAFDTKDQPVPVVADGQNVLLEVSVPGLDAGGSQTIGTAQFANLHLTAKSLAKFKNKYLIAVVDFGNAVAESNENNNNIVSPKVH